jgi:hypothetical protein
MKLPIHFDFHKNLHPQYLLSNVTFKGTHMNSCSKTSKEESSSKGVEKKDFIITNPSGFIKEILEAIKKEPLKGVSYF